MILIDIIVAIAPLYGYYTQLRLLQNNQKMGSFSIYVCAILILSSILRIYFWLLHPYKINLMLQSVFIIAIQLLILKECAAISQYSQEVQEFWKWNTFEKYIKFLIIFVAIVAVISVVCQLLTFGFYGTLVGCLSMGLEATLGLPQLISNYKAQSVSGLSIIMIWAWFIGDFFKTLYFIVESQPFQFIACGVFQISVDTIILIQIINYTSPPDFQIPKDQIENSKQ